MSKPFRYVLTATFLLVLGTYISGTILTPYAKEMGATWLQIGILSGSMYVIRLFFGVPIGRLADKKGTLTVLKYSLILYPLIAAAYYFAWNMPSLLCARLFHGVASAMMLPMGMAYVGHISPEGKEAKYMSRYNLCVILASGIGPMLSTMIAGYFRYRATFLVLFLLAVISLFVILLSKEEHQGMPGIVKPESIKQEDKKRFLHKGNKKGIFALSIANIALAVVSSLVGFFLVPFLTDKGLSLQYTGSYIAIYYLVSGIIQIPVGKLININNTYRTAILSGIGTAVAFLIVPFTDHLILLCLELVAIAVTSAVFLTAISSLSVRIGRKQGMGNTMGLLSSVNSAGMVFGCFILGLLPGTAGSYGWLFCFAGGSMLICTILFSALWLRQDIQ